MQKLRRNKFLAFCLSLLTAFLPVVSSVPVYSAATDDDAVTSTTDTDVTKDTAIEVSDGDKNVVVADKDTNVTFDMLNENGSITVRNDMATVEDTEDDVTQTVRIVTKEDSKKYRQLLDNDNKLISEAEITEEQPHALVIDLQENQKLYVDVKADRGFQVSRYSVEMDSGTANMGNREVISDEIIVPGKVTVDFAEKQDETTVVPETKKEESVGNQDEGIVGKIKDFLLPEGAVEKEMETSDETVKEDTAIESEDKTNDKQAVETDTTDKPETVETDKDVEEVQDSDSTDESVEVKTEETSDVKAPGEETEEIDETEHFVKDTMGVLSTRSYDEADFASMRLVVLADKPEKIVDPEHIIGQYDNIYLLQYKTALQTIHAYVYYLQNADAVEPDQTMETAEESTPTLLQTDDAEDLPVIEMTEEDNAVNSAAEAEESVTEETAGNVIALIDTGVPVGNNVIDSVSVIDDKVSGGTHGEQMLSSILSQNENASVLSVRAMNDKGYGTISSIVSAMEYAMNRNVKYINLSLYAKKSLANSILEAKINEAIDQGIVVAGAAGNAGEDVSDYVPGSFDRPYILGATDMNGNRLAISNYGSTVDYYIIADSTSEATALFTGFVSANGVDKLNEFSLIYNSVNEPTDVTVDVPEVTEEENKDCILDAYIENYVKEHADPEYVDGSKLDIVANMGVMQCLVDASMVSENPTLDSIFHGEDQYSYIGCGDVTTAIYDLDDKSDYYVTYVNTMQDNPRAEFAGIVVALNTVDGLIVKDEYWHYDEDTGLLYIPKTFYIDPETGKHLNGTLQVELVQKMYMDGSFEIASPVTATVSDGDNVFNAGTVVNAFEYYTTMKIEKNLDVDTLLVAVNGAPYPNNYYNYDPVTGILELPESSMMLQHVTVYSDGVDVTQTSAATKNVDTLPALNAPSTAVSANLAELKEQYTYYVTLNAWKHSNELDGDKYGRETYMLFKNSDTDNMNKAAGEIWEFMGQWKDNIEGQGATPADWEFQEFNYATDDDDEYNGRWTFNIGTTDFIAGYEKQTDGTMKKVSTKAPISFKKYRTSNKARIRSGCIEISKELDDVWNHYGHEGQHESDSGEWVLDYDSINANSPDSAFSNMLGSLPSVTKEHTWDLIRWWKNMLDKKLLSWYEDNTNLTNRKNEPAGFNTVHGDDKDNEVHALLRPLYVNDTAQNPYVIFAFVAERICDQAGFGLFKVYVKGPDNLYLRLQKAITNNPIGVLARGNAVYTLNDAKYGLYSDANCTTLVKDANGNDAIMTTDGNGLSNTLKLKGEPGTYYVKEIQASKNFKLDPTVYQVELGNDDDDENNPQMVSADGSGKVYEEPVGDAPEFNKQDPNAFTSSTWPNNTGPAGNQNYTNGRFLISYWDTEGTPSGSPKFTMEVKPDSMGHIDLTDRNYYTQLPSSGVYVVANQVQLPIGSYTIEEIVNPLGFLGINKTDYNASFKITQASNGSTNTNINISGGNYWRGSEAANNLTLYNEPYYQHVDIEKLDYDSKTNEPQGDADLSGIQFRIRNKSQNSIYIAGHEIGSGQDLVNITSNIAGVPSFDQCLTTDRDGKCSTRGFKWKNQLDKEVGGLPVGDYSVREIPKANGANDGYYLTDGREYDFSIALNGDGTKVVLNGRQIDEASLEGDYTFKVASVMDKVVRAGVSIQKYDNDNKQGVPEGNADLSGAEFKIVNASIHRVTEQRTGEDVGKSFATYKNDLGDSPSWDTVNNVINQHPNDVVATLTTDKNGYAETGKKVLAYGTYYIIETKAPTGYNIDKQFVGKIIIRTEGLNDAEDVIPLGTTSSPRVSLVDGNHSSFVDINGNKFDYFAGTRSDDTANAVDDQVYRSDIKFRKFDATNEQGIAEGDSHFENAEFMIINASSQRDFDGKVWNTATSNQVQSSYTSAKDGSSAGSFSNPPTWQELKNYADANPNSVVKINGSSVIKTDEDGWVSTLKADGSPNYALPYGDYYVIEVTPSEGHLIDKWFIGYVEVREDKTVIELEKTATSDSPSSFTDLNKQRFTRTNSSQLTEDRTKQAVDEPVYRSDISLEKGDLENKEQKPQGVAKLNDAEFTIINASSNHFDGKVWNIDASKSFVSCADGSTKATWAGANPTWQELKNYVTQHPDSVVDVIKTDENGHAETQDWTLPYGTYYVIETKAPYGYTIDTHFVGKVVIRENDKYNSSTNSSIHNCTPLGTNIGFTDTTKNAFWDLDETVTSYHSIHSERDSVGNITSTLYDAVEPDTTPNMVDDPVRRTDLYMFKVNDDGEWRTYVPFLLVAMDEDGNELESHVIVTDEYGVLSTAGLAGKPKRHDGPNYVTGRTRSADTVNGMDKYLDREKMCIKTEGEQYLEAAADWSVWFQEKDCLTAMDDYDGALYPAHYRLVELQCESNYGITENLIDYKTWFLYNNNVDLETPAANNANLMEYYFYNGVGVDHEIKVESFAADVETAKAGKPYSGSKVTSARNDVEVSDTVRFENLTASHEYRIETSFIDLTDGRKELPFTKAGQDTTLSSDNMRLIRYFSPERDATLAQTDNTHYEITLFGSLNTEKLNGHKLMAVDYIYEYIGVTGNEPVGDGAWVLVKIHPHGAVSDTNVYNPGDVTASDVVDENQCIYVPDIHTYATDGITGDRAGAKSADDVINDHVKYENLASGEVYDLQMTLVDTDTGEVLFKDSQNIPETRTVDTVLGYLYKSMHYDSPYDGEVDMKPWAIDTSAFEGRRSITVIEALYRLDDESGTDFPEPMLLHQSILDENETIRWIDVLTNARDRDTGDDVGTDLESARVYDNVTLHNVIFDDDDHDGKYSYTVKGHLVYQQDFTDKNGVEHKQGDTVETFDSSRDVVVISSDAAGNITFKYPKGGEAVGRIITSRHGYNVGHEVNPEDVANNEYIEDPDTLICDLEVEMYYDLNSEVLEGGSVVAFEYLYHDKDNNTDTSVSDVEIAKHEDILDKGQTVHYPKVRTSGVDDATKDDVGALRSDASITDTVKLWNLVPGRTYTVEGTLKSQDGSDFLIDGQKVTASAEVVVGEDGTLTAGGAKTTVTRYDEEYNQVDGTVDIVFHFDASGLEDRTCVVFEDLYHNNVKVAKHNDLRDKAQTVHFPKVRTTNTDEFTKDHVGCVREEAIINDDVKVWNLVPGRTYTLKGVLMDKRTGEKLLSNGEEITAEKTFTAAQAGDGITWDEVNEDLNRVDGTVRVVFKFDSSLMEDTISVAFETLEHNGVDVASHADLTDEEQTIHFPKIRTNAIDKQTGDEVGVVGKTIIRDKVNFWNLIPGLDYTISGQLYDKTTGEFLTDENGEIITQTNSFHINEDGTIDGDCCTPPCHCAGGTCTCEDYLAWVENFGHDPCDYVDGYANLRFDIDATDLEGHDIVVFETLIHNGAEVVKHHDPNDLDQTIHFPKLETTATDILTNTNAGTVMKDAVVKDTVKYSNLVIGKEYTIKGTLMSQTTGLPMLQEDGTPITAAATFTVVTESQDDVNTVLEVNEEDNSVTGEYILTFTVDSTQLIGQTVVVYEDLYHNDVKVDTHSDLYDHPQSVHYPEIRTTAIDKDTGDHVGSIWGALINKVRRLFGEKDADGNAIADDRQQNILDTVELDNLVPGLTYVVSGKLYDKDASLAQGENVPLLVDGKEVVKAVTITVAEDGSAITAADGSETSVVSYDEQTNTVNGTVVIVFSFDSSKATGKDVVAFETLYQDSTYTPETNPDEVSPEDIIHKHENIEDENQTVREVEITTTATDMTTGNHIGVVAQDAEDTSYVSVLSDNVVMKKLMEGMEYRLEGALVDINASDFDNGKVVYVRPDGTETEDRAEAYTQTVTFTAAQEEETHVLNFGMQSDKFQGRAITVFEDLYHNDVKITSHPGMDEEGWNKEDFSAQTVYYPTGKTNAVDNKTGAHVSDAVATSVITDNVYFENLLIGHEYQIDGSLMVQEDFTTADGMGYKAGDLLDVDGSKISVKFNASEDLAEAAYVGKDGKAVVTDLKVTEYPNGDKAISGYVAIEFEIDMTQFAGCTMVAQETFSSDGIKLFTHSDLSDEPQMVRIPKISTNAKVVDLDEASVYNEDGSYADITITDEVTYENLWTQEQVDALIEKGKHIYYADGSIREGKDDIYTITEKPVYILKGVLMDKETGEPLTDEDGKKYEVYSDSFTPEVSDGSYDIQFTVNAGDFVKDGSILLEGKTVVAFEDLYMAEDVSSISDDNHVAEHHDIDDAEQDIRFPKLRTHLADGDKEALLSQHETEDSSVHEVFADENITITDSVSFENLHGGTKYTVTGTLQVVTETDKNGVPTKWEEAKDDAGNVITQTVELDTSSYDADFNASVSGSIPLRFTFSGKSLEGKTMVAFEKLEREGVLVGLHADIKDEPQIVFVPKIRTNATELLSDIHLANAGEDTVVADAVTYENLEKGKTYTLKAVLHKKSDGSELSDTVVTGTFVAGEDNQVIFKDGTRILTLDQVRKQYTATRKDDPNTTTGNTTTGTTGTGSNRAFGDTSKLVVGQDIEPGYYRVNGGYDRFDKFGGYWAIFFAKDGSVPTILDDMAANGVLGYNGYGNSDVIRLEKNMILEMDDNYYSMSLEEVPSSTPLNESVAWWYDTHWDEENHCYVEYKDLLMSDASVDADTEGASDSGNKTMVLSGSEEWYSSFFGNDNELVVVKPVESETRTEGDTSNMMNRVNGSVTVILPVNATELAGDTVVAFETLFANGKKIAEHADITDEAQSVYIPKVTTNAYFGEDSKEAGAAVDMTVNDMVTYQNVIPGQEYTLVGELHDKETGNVVGEAQTMTFTADSADGSVLMAFPFDGHELAGKQLVVFETLKAKGADGELYVVAKHHDINDEAQTVTITQPAITTNAKFKDGNKAANADKSMTVVDTVTYENLTPGVQYTLNGELYYKENGKTTGITATAQFTPSAANGSYDLSFTFDGTKLEGKQLVVFETLLAKDKDGKDYIVAEHHDINDAAQTVTINPAPKNKKVKSVDTGDVMNVGMVIGFIVSIIMLAGVYILRKRKFTV
jgi:hypothetical protein